MFYLYYNGVQPHCSILTRKNLITLTVTQSRITFGNFEASNVKSLKSSP